MEDEFEDIHEDECRNTLLLDNKGMVQPAPSERSSQHTVNIDISRNQQDVTCGKKRLRLRNLLRVPYIINVLVAVIVLPMLYLLEFGIIPGTKLGFVCNDPVISHRYTGDTISPVTLLVGSALGPLIITIIVEAIIKENIRAIRPKDIWFYYKECLIGSIFVLVITEVMKIIVGEHRPHFIDVCKPNTNVNCHPGTFIESYNCTNTEFSNYFLTDSSRSFPSGHSSTSVFVAVYCAYIVHIRLPTVRTGELIKPFLVAVCLTWGVLCSLSRIVDRRHHWWDVLAGMVLGVCGAVYTLRVLSKKLDKIDNFSRTSTSTTTLLDMKNKGATSVII